MNPILRRSIATLACISFSIGSASAADFTWIGGAGDNILEPANWQNGIVPPNDGTHINLTATDRILFDNSAPVVTIPNAGGRQINVPVGAQIVSNAISDPTRTRIEAQINIAGSGPDGNGAFFVSGTNWGLPQNVRLDGDASIEVSNNARYRMDGGPNRLDLNGKTLTVGGTGIGGAGETNFVNTNIYATSGTIVSNHLLAIESATRVDPNVTIDMAPSTTLTSWSGGGHRREAAVILRNNAILETRHADRDLTYTGPITVNAGDTGILRAQVQATGQAGDGTDQRLNITGQLQGAGVFRQAGNGTLMLSGNNTYTGGTNLEGAAGGAVLAASDTAFGTGAVNVNNASTVHLSNAGGLEFRDDAARDAEITGTSTTVNPALTGLHSTQGYDQTRFSYTGKINNTSGGDVVYTFAEQYDDDVFLQVDGVTVLNDATWNVVTTGQITLAPGEHDIRITVRNGGGGAGPNNGWDKGIGISTAFALGAATTNNADYAKLGNALEVYQGTDRSYGNNFVLNQPLTLTTTHMNGHKATVSGTLAGASSLIVQGSAAHATDQLILSGTNTYAGDTTVQAGGSLQLTGSHTNAGNYQVEAGGTLLINGQFIVGDSATPGVAADLLLTNAGVATFGESANLRLELFANAPGTVASENDKFITLAGVAPGLGGTLSIENPTGINNWALGDTWDLFDWGTAPTGTFAAINLPQLTPDLAWSTADLYNGGTVQIVPEPSAAALLAIFGAGALLRRRRRA